MSVCLSVYLFGRVQECVVACLAHLRRFVCPSMCQLDECSYVCMSGLCLCVCVSGRTPAFRRSSLCLRLSLSIWLCVYLSAYVCAIVYLWLFICFYVCLPKCLFACVSVYMSFSLLFCLCDLSPLFNSFGSVSNCHCVHLFVCFGST